MYNCIIYDIIWYTILYMIKVQTETRNFKFCSTKLKLQIKIVFFKFYLDLFFLLPVRKGFLFCPFKPVQWMKIKGYIDFESKLNHSVFFPRVEKKANRDQWNCSKLVDNSHWQDDINSQSFKVIKYNNLKTPKLFFGCKKSLPSLSKVLTLSQSNWLRITKNSQG